MLLKWKIYYWFSAYYFLWTVAMLGMFVYSMVSDTNPSYGEYTVLFVPLIMLAKPLLSIKFITYYKNKTLYQNRELILFVAAFIANIVYTLVIALMFLVLLANSTADINFSSGNILITLSTPLFIIASVYLIIFDLPLKSLIRRQYNGNIATIGTDIPESL